MQKKFSQIGEYLQKSKKDTRSKLNDEEKMIIDWVDHNCLLKLADFVKQVNEKFSKKISESMVNHILRVSLLN